MSVIISDLVAHRGTVEDQIVLLTQGIHKNLSGITVHNTELGKADVCLRRTCRCIVTVPVD
jgi:hypothetical protein